jgi:hypothetical protein
MKLSTNFSASSRRHESDLYTPREQAKVLKQSTPLTLNANDLVEVMDLRVDLSTAYKIGSGKRLLRIRTSIHTFCVISHIAPPQHRNGKIASTLGDEYESTLRIKIKQTSYIHSCMLRL